MKLPGDPHVYHARGNFRSEFDQTVDTLRDKLVLAVKAGDLHEIRITTEGQTTIIRKRPSEPAKTESKNKAGAAAPQHKAEWETDTGKTVDADRFAGFLNSFSQLNCDKYIDQKEKKDFQNPHYQLHFIGKKEHHLSLFGKSDPEAENYPGLSSASPYPFLLTSSRVDRIKEDVREMLQLPKPEPANPKEKSTDASQ